MDFRYLGPGQLSTDIQGLKILKGIGEGEIRLPDQNLAQLVRKSALATLETIAKKELKAGALADRDFVLIHAGIKKINKELDKQHFLVKKGNQTSKNTVEIKINQEPSFLNPLFTKAGFLIRAGLAPKEKVLEMATGELKEALIHIQVLYRIGIVDEKEVEAFIKGFLALIKSESGGEWEKLKAAYNKDTLKTQIISKPKENYAGIITALGDYIDLDIIAPEASGTLKEIFSSIRQVDPKAEQKIAGSINKLIFKCFLLRKYMSIEDPERRKSAFSNEISEIVSAILDVLPEEEERIRIVNSFLYFLRDQAFITNSQRPFEQLINQYATTGETSRAITIAEHANDLIKKLHNKNLKRFLEGEGQGATLRFEGISTLWEKYRLIEEPTKKGVYHLTMLTLIDEKSVKRAQISLDLSPFLAGCDDAEIKKRLPYLFKAIHAPSILLEAITNEEPLEGLEAFSKKELLALHQLGEAFRDKVEIEMSRVIQRPRKN